MDDLISRQAAIEALTALEEPAPTARHLSAIYDCEDAIKALPPAQPEVLACGEGVLNAQPEIVRCGQCKYAEVADAQDNQDGYTCQFHRGSIWFSGSYCSWGERRTDEGD